MNTTTINNATKSSNYNNSDSYSNHDTFTRAILNNSSVHANIIISYLLPHERIASRSVSRIFAAVVKGQKYEGEVVQQQQQQQQRQSSFFSSSSSSSPTAASASIWSSCVYQHDGIASSYVIRPPRSPFSLMMKVESQCHDPTGPTSSSNTQLVSSSHSMTSLSPFSVTQSQSQSQSQSHSTDHPVSAEHDTNNMLPYPPVWLRQVIGGLHLRGCRPREMYLALTRFDSLLSLHLGEIKSPPSGIDTDTSDDTVAKLRLAFRIAFTTGSLESLEIDSLNTTLMSSIFGEQNPDKFEVAAESQLTPSVAMVISGEPKVPVAVASTFSFGLGSGFSFASPHSTVTAASTSGPSENETGANENDGTPQTSGPGAAASGSLTATSTSDTSSATATSNATDVATSHVTSDSVLTSKDEWLVEPLIWLLSSRLKHLLITSSSWMPHSNKRAFLAAMAQRQWPCLERLQCIEIDLTLSGRLNDEIPAKRLFTPEALPRLSHLDVHIECAVKDDIIRLHSQLAELPSLTALNLVSAAFYEPKKKHTTTNSRSSNSPILPQNLTHLRVERTWHWSAISQLSHLTQLVLNKPKHELVNNSLELFQAIGHHNLPRLHTLSVECYDEPIIDDHSDAIAAGHSPAHVRVLELMSRMTSLTALHSERVVHTPNGEELTNEKKAPDSKRDGKESESWVNREPPTKQFNWFLHLYRFTALCQLEFLLVAMPSGLRENRNEPLPLPVDITLGRDDEHPLYPHGGRHLKSISTKPQRIPDVPKWLKFDISAEVHEKEIRFGLPEQPTFVYLDQDKFRKGGQLALIPPATTDLNTLSVNTTSISLHSRVFSSIMTDLCMVKMFEFLPLKERMRNLAPVDRYFHRSLLHPSLWRSVTFDMCDRLVTPLPASICQLIGGLKLTSGDANTIFPLCHASRSLKRVDLKSCEIDDPSSTFCTRTVWNALASLKIEYFAGIVGSGTLFSSIDAPEKNEHLRMSEALFGIKREGIDTESSHWISFFGEKKKEQIATDPNPLPKDPILWSYADSLKRLDLTVRWNTDSRLHSAMSQRVWSKLESAKIKYQPFTIHIPGRPSHHVDQLPFEDLFVAASTVLPQLTSLDFSMELQSRSIEDLPVASLTRIFTALADANTLTTLRHSLHLTARWKITEEEDRQTMIRNFTEYTQVYPRSLTSLEIEWQVVDWKQIAMLHSLTQLTLNGNVNTLTPTELFEYIGHHSLPALTTLSIDECTTHEYDDVTTCQRESMRVCQLMSQMTSLTRLHSRLVSYESNLSTSFSWFAHAALFPSLCHVEYLHNFNATQGYGSFWRHSLLPIPISSISMLSGTPSLVHALSHPLLPTINRPTLDLAPTIDSSTSATASELKSHYLPFATSSWHVYAPLRAVARSDELRYISITVQEEYEHLSVEELRLIQQQQFEESDTTDLPLHDHRVSLLKRNLNAHPNEYLLTLPTRPQSPSKKMQATKISGFASESGFDGFGQPPSAATLASFFGTPTPTANSSGFGFGASSSWSGFGGPGFSQPTTGAAAAATTATATTTATLPTAAVATSSSAPYLSSFSFPSFSSSTNGTVDLFSPAAPKLFTSSTSTTSTTGSSVSSASLIPANLSFNRAIPPSDWISNGQGPNFGFGWGVKPNWAQKSTEDAVEPTQTEPKQQTKVETTKEDVDSATSFSFSSSSTSSVAAASTSAAAVNPPSVFPAQFAFNFSSFSVSPNPSVTSTSNTITPGLFGVAANSSSSSTSSSL